MVGRDRCRCPFDLQAGSWFFHLWYPRGLLLS